jgi:hypothetical protein
VKAWLAARTIKEWLALIAIIGSLIGAGVLTANRIWLIGILERAEQWVAIADIAKLDTLIIGLVLIGLGLAINKRSVKLGAGGFEASGGE